MRYLILTDMHANWEALQAVLRRARRKRFDAVLVLGDLVGYGAAPNQVVDAIRSLARPVYSVRGNHDKVVARIDDGGNFNQAALQAARWTEERLTSSNLRYVHDLIRGPLKIAEGLAICHGSPLDEDTYVFSNFDAYSIFVAFPIHVTFFGHTHVPSLFVLRDGGIEVRLLRGESGRLELDEDARYLINPGSVGQPRDRDPRAAYMTYDSERQVVRWYRVEYAIDKAQERINEAGLPDILAERLAVGV